MKKKYGNIFSSLAYKPNRATEKDFEIFKKNKFFLFCPKTKHYFIIPFKIIHIYNFFDIPQTYRIDTFYSRTSRIGRQHQAFLPSIKLLRFETYFQSLI